MDTVIEELRIAYINDIEAANTIENAVILKQKTRKALRLAKQAVWDKEAELKLGN